MKTKLKKECKNPGAWLVNPKDRGRLSIKNGKCFLEDNSYFEIELFNPLTVSALADIKLNGQSISKTGLVVKPGQRIYLDCFIDDRKKFKFSTYEIENSGEALDATQNNGLLEVFFYKEDVITLDNWQKRFDRIIVEKHYYPYNPNPWYNPYYGNGTITTSITDPGIVVTSNNNTYTTNLGISTNNCTYTSGNIDLSNCIGTLTTSNNMTSINTSIETGRVEKGSSSSQKFTEVDMDFEKNYISSTIIQILPESRKPAEIKDVKEINLQGKVKVNGVELKDLLKRESDDVIDLIKKLADLHSAGILTDEEFSAKKTELLSKI